MGLVSNFFFPSDPLFSPEKTILFHLLSLIFASLALTPFSPQPPHGFPLFWFFITRMRSEIFLHRTKSMFFPVLSFIGLFLDNSFFFPPELGPSFFFLSLQKTERLMKLLLKNPAEVPLPLRAPLVTNKLFFPRLGLPT